jgi:hypothetical protein
LSLTPEELEVLQETLARNAHRIGKELQEQWQKALNAKWPRAFKDQALATARALNERANARAASGIPKRGEDDPDWGLF